MWLEFGSIFFFAIKVHLSGVSAVSGKSVVENVTSKYLTVASNCWNSRSQFNVIIQYSWLNNTKQRRVCASIRRHTVGFWLICRGISGWNRCQGGSTVRIHAYRTTAKASLATSEDAHRQNSRAPCRIPFPTLGRDEGDDPGKEGISPSQQHLLCHEKLLDKGH